MAVRDKCFRVHFFRNSSFRGIFFRVKVFEEMSVREKCFRDYFFEHFVFGITAFGKIFSGKCPGIAAYVIRELSSRSGYEQHVMYSRNTMHRQFSLVYKFYKDISKSMNNSLEYSTGQILSSAFKNFFFFQQIIFFTHYLINEAITFYTTTMRDGIATTCRTATRR